MNTTSPTAPSVDDLLSMDDAALKLHWYERTDSGIKRISTLQANVKNASWKIINFEGYEIEEYTIDEKIADWIGFRTRYEESSTPESLLNLIKESFSGNYEHLFSNGTSISEVRFEGASIEELITAFWSDEDTCERDRYAVLSNGDYLLVQSSSIDSDSTGSIYFEYQKRLTSYDLDTISLYLLGFWSRELETLAEEIPTLDSQLETFLAEKNI